MKRPSETHPATREERGHSERLYFTFSSPTSCVSLHPPSPSCPPPPFILLSLSTSSSRDLASFAETGYENWRTRESRSLLSVPRAPTWPISTSNSSHVSDPGDKTLLVREIKRDPRRLVNNGTGWSFIRFYDTQTYMIRFRCISPLWASHFLEHPFFDSLDIHYTFV